MPDPAVPMREVFWNITGKNLIYVLLVPMLAVLGWAFWRRARLWRIGRPSNRFDRWRARLAGFFRDAVVQERNLRRPYRTSGWMHLLIYGGFVILFIGTTNVALDEWLHIPTMEGAFYLVFQSLVLDVFGLLAIAGIAMAAWQRYRVRPARYHRTTADAILLGGLFVILVTGFVVEGLRIAATADPWRAWSPVGAAVGWLFSAAGLAEPALRGLHRGLWWFHLLASYTWLAALPLTKMMHLFTSPANIYLRSLKAKGALEPIDLETATTLGAGDLTGFTWKQLFDFDACTECGRCQDACPAWATSKPLNPKWVILDLRDYMHEFGPLYLARARAASANGRAAEPLGPPTETRDGKPVPAMVGDVVTDEVLWACTTCMACMEACPVEIEHVPTIVDMRRHLVMERAEFPEGMQDAVRSLETRGHPFKGITGDRTEWAAGLELNDLSKPGADLDFDVLWWVGCAGAFDERNQRVAQALARVLGRAGVRFAILGKKERCCGDPARRIGHEYLYQQFAQENVATLNAILGGDRPKRVITACPHCFNTLKNEYPQFGGNYEVQHHSEFMQELIADGRLTLEASVAEKITYHDPCYLGRYNRVFDAPRQAVEALPGAELLEMARSRERSFCCGGGGALVFVEETIGARINQTRAQEAIDTGAEVVCTSCPFCMTMLEDGLKTRSGGDVIPLDLAELVDRASAPAQARSPAPGKPPEGVGPDPAGGN